MTDASYDDLRRRLSELEDELAAFARLTDRQADDLVVRAAEADRQSEVARALGAQFDEHARALANCQDEVRELRASWSWRLTAPLRTVYGWWLRRRR